MTTGKSSTDETRAAKTGDVVSIGEGRYALVVGTESVEHVSDRGEKTTETHPLVVDLVGARRLESEHSIAA